MVSRNKDECLREAGRLGIDASGMKWPELQATVAKALREEQEGTDASLTEVHVVRRPERKPDPMDAYRGKTVLMSPEMEPTNKRLMKYREMLGPALEVEERQFDINPDTDEMYDHSAGDMGKRQQASANTDYYTGTYRVIGDGSGRRVEAIASLPKENPGQIMRIDVDYCPLYCWQGRYGYRWTHVRNLLMQPGSDYYMKYKNRFEHAKFYACGVLCVDPLVANQVFHEIEEEVREKRIRKRAMDDTLGIGGTR